MLRSLFISIFYFGVIVICVIFLPSLLLPKKICFYGGKIMGIWSKICLQYILSVNVKILGEENIIKNEKFFIACSHQSAFETYYLQTIYENPIFVLKKELTKIPLFGWYLKKVGSIVIDRNKYTKDNLSFFENIQENYRKNLNPVIIFPQGTRVSNSYREPFKKGVFKIYDTLKIKCQPVAINSGTVWPKDGELGKNRTLYVSILKPIDPGLDTENFMANLQNSIYSELDKLN